MCESTERVDKVPAPGLTDDVLMENYVKRDVPVIVTGASPLKGDITLHRLAQLYSEHPVLKRYFSCGLASNVRQTSGDHVELLRNVVDDKLDKFYAKWENCNRDAAKAFRSLYRRPQFLPSAVSVSASNWVYVASNYTGKLYKPVDVAQSLVIFMQVKGESRVKMEPWSPCDQICSHFVEALEEGDVLIATDFLWKVDYLPTNKSENIAIAFGGSFD
ncbi:uncharacterized protein LOC106014112 [Aplysia californica]|uniref:Uncharacterized protein LOC106014112 n=1 Tax=Aplysia californica TaxID=6500 RepID=A0ABM1AFF6_APLCA|nr:uncharacterized protein LOC106014112 [Aplysia californica]